MEEPRCPMRQGRIQHLVLADTTWSLCRALPKTEHDQHPPLIAPLSWAVPYFLPFSINSELACA